MFERLQKKHFEIESQRHAEAILRYDIPQVADELEDILLNISISLESLIRGGGGESTITQMIRRALYNNEWNKRRFVIRKIVDEEETESTSHEVDHVKAFDRGTVALEIEWNNKDPFFDRDLDNFKRLHAESAISVGIIITRGSSIQRNLEDMIYKFACENSIQCVEEIYKYYTPTKRQIKNILDSKKRFNSFERGWAHAFVADKFGQATTHWDKLAERVKRGVGSPCPLVLIGLPISIIRSDAPGRGRK